MAPLPRAYQWADGSAYVNHVELVRKARGATMPPEFWTDPLMYQGASDHMLGACDDIVLADEAWGIDFEAEVAVITGDVPMGTPAADARAPHPPADARQRRQPAQPDSGRARQGLRLLPVEAGERHSRRSRSRRTSSGDAWRDGKVHLPLVSHLNGALFGRPNAGVDMTFDFATLIAHVAKTRELEAGSIVGSGTVSNKEDGGPGRPAAAGGVGYSCIAEQRTVETMLDRQGDDAVHALRRPRPHRDARRRGSLDLRRHRPEGSSAGLTVRPAAAPAVSPPDAGRAPSPPRPLRRASDPVRRALSRVSSHAS